MAQVSSILARLKRDPIVDLPITQAIEQLYTQYDFAWCERLLSPGVLLRLFLIQILHGNCPINALRQLSGLMVPDRNSEPSGNSFDDIARTSEISCSRGIAVAHGVLRDKEVHMQLSGKVALVTGAGSGIGKAAAIRFAKEGARVGVLSDDVEEVRKTVDEIGREQAMGLTADVSDPQAVQRAVDQCAHRLGRLDVVFANAGINGVWAPIDELTPEEWNKTLGINLSGTFYTIKYSAPHLKRGGGGSIIVTSSVNGTRTFSNTGATAYSTTKAGQLAMAKMLALEFARDNIRVNVICPGAVDTNIGQNTEQRDVDRVKIKAEFERQVPLSNRPATADEVADLALFLASDASRHITGTPIWIDGASSLLRG